MPNGRTWEQTSSGLWASREATKNELAIEALMQQWARGQINYKTVLKEIKRRKLDS